MSMDSLLEQAKVMKEKQQRELAEILAEGRGADGGVAVNIDGHKHLRRVRIAPELIDPEDLHPLAAHVMNAVNEATEKMEGILERKFGPSSGIPDLF